MNFCIYANKNVLRARHAPPSACLSAYPHARSHQPSNQFEPNLEGVFGTRGPAVLILSQNLLPSSYKYRCFYRSRIADLIFALASLPFACQLSYC